jgi:hypothetical protein
VNLERMSPKRTGSDGGFRGSARAVRTFLESPTGGSMKRLSLQKGERKMGTINSATDWINSYHGFKTFCGGCNEEETRCMCCRECGAPPSDGCDCDEYEREGYDRIEDGVVVG